jgi:hypothetical protein
MVAAQRLMKNADKYFQNRSFIECSAKAIDALREEMITKIPPNRRRPQLYEFAGII